MNTNIKHLSVPGIFFILFFASVSTLYSANISVEVQENIDLLIKTNQCVDCNLAGADLNRLNLSGADLRGADLSNATFFLADLSNANLSRAILRGTQFGGADLADADLRKADLRGVKIAGAYLVGSQFDGTFSDVPVSDDNDVQEVVEKTYIPDDSVPKKVVENKQVNIADRRDFGPVPPQIDPSMETAPDMQQGGPVKQSAPPKKIVSPVKEITLQPETSDNEDTISEQDLTEVAPDQQVETASVSDEARKDGDSETAELAKNFNGATAPIKTEVSVDEQPILVASKSKQSPTPEETVQQEPDDSNDQSIKDTPLKSDTKEERVAETPVSDVQKIESAGISVEKDDDTAENKVIAENSQKTKASVDEQPILVASKSKQSPTPDETVQRETDDSSDESMKDTTLKSDTKEESLAETPVSDVQRVEPAVASDGENDDPFENKVIAENNQKKEVVTERPEVAEAEIVVEESSLEADNNVQQVVPESIEEVKDEVSPELLEQQKRLSKYKKCYNCNLAGSDFSGKNFDGADLEGSDFTGANLEKVDFEKANLKGVSFRNANLKNAKFNKADLYKADFTGADLTGAEFNKALIDETNFQDTIGYGSLMINQPE